MMLVTIDHHELAALEQERDSYERGLRYANANIRELMAKITALRQGWDLALKILEEWTCTCAQICDNSYDLTVRAKELRFPPPCADCSDSADNTGEGKSTISIDILEIHPPEDADERENS